MSQTLSDYCFSRLSDAGKKAYRQLEKGLEHMERQITLKEAMEDEELKRVIRALLWEHPLYFHVDTFHLEIIQTGKLSRVAFSYLYSSREAGRLKEELAERAALILHNILREGMTEYEKVLAVHEYLKQNIRYDHSALAVSYFTEARTVVGAILRNSAVCSGIAQAAQYLLSMAGVDVMYISGESRVLGQKASHSWNLVAIDGSFYHLDVTWDLQEVNRMFADSHMFLNLDDDSMFGEHSWELDDYPACSSRQANYYVVNRLYFRTIRSFELYVQSFLRAGGSCMEVRFEDTLERLDEEGMYIRDIILEQAKQTGIRSIRISHTFNRTNCIFMAMLQYGPAD